MEARKLFNLIFGIFFLLLFTNITLAANGNSSTYTVWSKFDFGGTSNANSSTYANRFISGNQPVSQYNASDYTGRFGISSSDSSVSINITYPLNYAEIIRGADQTNEDDLGLVSDTLQILSKVFYSDNLGGISNVNVSFYLNETFIAGVLTNSTGFASINQDKSNYAYGDYNLSTNYTTALSKDVSISQINISIASISIPNYVGNKGVSTQYVWNQTITFLFNVTKSNSSGTFFYDPLNVIANATDSTDNPYPNESYVEDYRTTRVQQGQYESRILLNQTLLDEDYTDFIRWKVFVSDDNWNSFIGSALHTDVGIVDGPLCGNGILESGEECDDGNLNNGDTCTSSCLSGSGSSGGGGGGGCSDECFPAGSSELTCVTGSTLRERSCGNFDSDSCLEWGSELFTDCGENSCENAACIQSICEEDWQCGNWGECFYGDIDDSSYTFNQIILPSVQIIGDSFILQQNEDYIQTRDCVDLNSCGTENEKPNTVAMCQDICEEDWSCQWTLCTEGDQYSEPYNCFDRNDCGTNFDLPEEIACGEQPLDEIYEDCSNTWACSDWGSCDADYKFNDVLDRKVSLIGSQERNCYDKYRSCGLNITEYRECSYAIPITSEVVEWCEENYVEIIDRNTGNIVSRIKQSEVQGSLGSRRVDISLVTADFSGYCGYCSNGIQDYDEEGVDCGGPSCSECVTVYSFFDWAFWLTILLWFLLAPLLITLSHEEREEYEKEIDLEKFLKEAFASGTKKEKQTERNLERFFSNLFVWPRFASRKKSVSKERIVYVHKSSPKENLVSRLKRKIKEYREKGYHGTAKLESNLKNIRITDHKKHFQKQIKRKKKQERKEHKKKIRKVKREIRKRKILNLMNKIGIWKKEGYYGTAKLESELRKLKRGYK